MTTSNFFHHFLKMILGSLALGSKPTPNGGLSALLGTNANPLSEKEEIISEFMKINEGAKLVNESSEISEKVPKSLSLFI